MIYTATQLAKSEDWPHASTWAPGKFWSVVLVISGIVALVGFLLVTFGYDRALRRSTQNLEFGAICRDIASRLSQDTTIPYDRIGVHVWVVKGWKGMRHLDRRAQFIPIRRPPTSITWRKGKGAMGVCWEKDNPVLADVEALEARAPTEAEFCALSRSDRFGLTWDEFEATKHYRAILAMPLRLGPPADRRVAGVISIDVQTDGKAHELRTLLSTQSFSYVLSVCEDVLASR